MKQKHPFAYGLMTSLLVGALAFTATACSIFDRGDTNIFAPTQTNNQSVGAPAPTPSGSPVAVGSSELCPAVRNVRVGPFGFTCPTGVTVPANSAGILPVGCEANVTASGKDAAGNEVALTDAYPISWGQGGPHVSLRSWPAETFNQIVTGLTPGAFDIPVTVCGVTGHYAGEVR